MKMNTKYKSIIIGAGIILFVFCVCFAMIAGTTIGSDIGEFIYNITH